MYSKASLLQEVDADTITDLQILGADLSGIVESSDATSKVKFVHNLPVVICQ